MTTREWLKKRSTEHLQAFLDRLRETGFTAPARAVDLLPDATGLMAMDMAVLKARIELLDQAVGELARGKRAAGPEAPAGAVKH